jgi:hypothetical protein
MRAGDRTHTLLFEAGTGRWRELGTREWERLRSAMERDWRDGVWVPEGSGVPFQALRLTAVGRWELAGETGDRWLARTHDGVTWRRCECTVEAAEVTLGAGSPTRLFLTGTRLLAAGRGWSLRRLPDPEPEHRRR